jgi:predicted nucleic acid-binding protein
MTTVFADSSFYVALIVARDSNHAKAKAIAQSWSGAAVTTEYVLVEVANHLGRTAQQRGRFGQLLADIESDPSTEVIESTHSLWQRGINLYLQRPDKTWSLTDCTSFVVMQERGLTEALTADHHFDQAGFKALLV